MPWVHNQKRSSRALNGRHTGLRSHLVPNTTTGMPGSGLLVASDFPSAMIVRFVICAEFNSRLKKGNLPSPPPSCFWRPFRPNANVVWKAPGIFLCPFTNTSYAKATAKCAAASSRCSARFRRRRSRNVRPARSLFARSGRRLIRRRPCRFQTLRRPGLPFSSARARENTKGSNANLGLSHLDKGLSRPFPRVFPERLDWLIVIYLTLAEQVLLRQL